jgi:hypothetical protein
MNIAFNTARTAVTISMPGYVHKMLTRFRPQFLDKAHRPAQTPGRYTVPVYGKKSPQLTSVDDAPRLPSESITELQAIIGTLLYYARAVDPSLLPISNELASKQTQPTTAVMNAASRALSYCAGKPNMATTYYACDMILTVFVDASYLSRSMARSVVVVGCIFYLENRHTSTHAHQRHHFCHLYDHSLHCIHRRSTCCWASHHPSRYGIPVTAHYDLMR